VLHGRLEIFGGAVGQTQAVVGPGDLDTLGSVSSLEQSHGVQEFRERIIVKSLVAQRIADVVMLDAGIVAGHDGCGSWWMDGWMDCNMDRFFKVLSLV